MFSGLSGGKKGSGRRLLTGSGDDGGEADRSSGGGSKKSGSGLTNPFATAASGSKYARSASDSGARSSSPLKESLSSGLGRFDPRQLWGGASSTSKDDGPSKAADQAGTTGASTSRAGAGSSSSTSAAAYASRRFLSSDDTTKATSEQPSAATGATALSSATAATPFSSATAAAPPPALGLLGQRSSSYSQRSGSATFGRSSSNRQEHISTLPSEEIDEVWATLDSEKGPRPATSSNPSPEPGSRWGRSDSQTSSRAGTPAGGLSAAGAAGIGLPRSGSRGAAGSRLLSSPASPPDPVWSQLSGTGVTGTQPSAAAAGGTGDSTSSSPRDSSLKDRAKLVREYVRMRSTPTPTPKSSTTGEPSYLQDRLTAGSEGGRSGSALGGASSLGAAAAGVGAGAAAGGVATSLWRSRTASPEGGTGSTAGGSSMQPSPLMGGGSGGPQLSPLMGAGSSSGLSPSPLMGGGGLGASSRSMRVSDTSLPPSPVMPDSPTAAGRPSDASGGALLQPGGPYQTTGSGTVRLSSLVAAETRMRRQTTGGSTQSSPRAPVGIAETEFRRRGSTPDEIEEELTRGGSSLGGGAAAAATGGGLRTLSSARNLSQRDSATVSAPGAAPSSGNPFASSSTGGAAAAGAVAAVGAAAAAAARSSPGGRPATAGSSGSAAAAGRARTAGTSAGGRAAAAGAAGAVSGKPGFLGSLFGIRRKQQDVEAPPSPKRAPAAAATPLGPSIKAQQQQARARQQQQQGDTAPVYDFYGADGATGRDVYAPAAYVDEREAYDRGAYSAGGGGYYGPPPPQADAYKPAGYSKPAKDHHVNYKRMFYALLLMLALAGVAVGIWAGVTYGRNNGEPAVPPLKPTNFTMSLAAGGKNANGTAENCTDWFSNSTGVEKFRQTVADAYSRALNLPVSAIKVGDVGCKPAPPKRRSLLAQQSQAAGDMIYHITTSVSIGVPIEGADLGGGLSEGLLEQIKHKVAAFFRRDGGSASSSSSSSGAAVVTTKPAPAATTAAAAANRTSARLLLQDTPGGGNAISSGITVELPTADPEVSEEIIKRIEQDSGQILSEPLSNLLGVPVAVEQVQHVGQTPLPAAPAPPPPPPPSPPPPPPSPPPPPPPRPPAPPPPPIGPWRPPVGVLPPTPANIIVIPDPSPRPRRRRKKPEPIPQEPITDLDVGDVGPPRRSPRPRVSPSPAAPAIIIPPPVVPLPEIPRPSPSPSPLPPSPPPAPVRLPPPPPPPPPSPPVVPEPLPTDTTPSPSPRPRRRRRRSPSPAILPAPNEAMLPYPSPSPAPVVPPPAPLPTALTPTKPPPQNPELIANQPGGAVFPSPDGALALPSPSPLVVQPPLPDATLTTPVPALPPQTLPDVSAPSCTKAPTSLNSVADSSGRLWGWEKGVSCIFRAAAVGPSQPVSYAATTWQAAPTCWGMPTPQTSVLDDLGRLWGWQSGRSCAFRNIPPLGGVSPAPVVEWESAPTCMFAPTQQNSVPDTKGRLWGWQNSQSCAFRG